MSAQVTKSDEGEKTCPLCAEEMDLSDQQLKPCKCGYEDVKTHPDSGFMSLTPVKRKEENAAGPSPDAKRRDVKTEGVDSEVFSSSTSERGDAICSDDEELSDISDEEVDTIETLNFEGEEIKMKQRNGELVEFSYLTKCGDFTALKKALEEFDVPGSRRYKKRFRLVKGLQEDYEKVAEGNPRFHGKLRVKVMMTKEKGHLSMASMFMPSVV